MSVTANDVLQIAPELSVITSAQWTAILADVALQIDGTVWGLKTDLATKYLAAHYATLTKGGGSGTAGGLVTGRKVGEVSETYATPRGPMNSDSLMMTTKYGVMYVALLKQIPRWLVL